jgi:D-alanine transaminase
MRNGDRPPHPLDEDDRTRRLELMAELAYVNGAFGPIADAVVSVEDRGLQFGDGVYDVIVAYGGRPFQLGPHLERLRRSAAAVRLDYDFDRNPIEPIITEGLRRSGLADAVIYVQLTRGTAPRAHEFPHNTPPTVIMTIRTLPVVPNALQQRGARLMTTLDVRWAHCYIKAITLLPNVLAKNEALQRGYDDAIFVTAAGEVRECTACNLFIARNGRLTIPPRDESILHGVTQGFLLECCEAIDIPVAEDVFDVAALHAADEVFVSGTAVDVLGVASVDDRPIADGRVGPITRRLYDEFVKRARGTA